jgi:hypothetical protein
MTYFLHKINYMKTYLDSRRLYTWAKVFSLSVMLLAISAAMIGMSSAAVVSLQHANAISNDGKTAPCRHHVSEVSKCSQKNTPFILPFP